MDCVKTLTHHPYFSHTGDNTITSPHYAHTMHSFTFPIFPTSDTDRIPSYASVELTDEKLTLCKKSTPSCTITFPFTEPPSFLNDLLDKKPLNHTLTLDSFTFTLTQNTTKDYFLFNVSDTNHLISVFLEPQDLEKLKDAMAKVTQTHTVSTVG